MRWPTPSSWSCKRQHTSRYVVAILLCRVVALAVIFVATGIGCLIVCRLVRLTPIWFRRCKLGLQGGPIITGTWRKYFLCYNDSNLTPIPHPNKMWGHLEWLEPYRTILAVTHHYSLRIESWVEFGDVVNWCCQRDQSDFFFNFKRSFSSVEAYSSRDIVQESCCQLTTAFFNSVSWLLIDGTWNETRGFKRATSLHDCRGGKNLVLVLVILTWNHCVLSYTMKQVLPVLLDEYCTKLITFAVAGISVLNLAVPGPRVSVKIWRRVTWLGLVHGILLIPYTTTLSS